MRETVGQGQKRVLKIFKMLRRTYPGIRCPIRFSNPWQLLVATILSAQCTDKQVNRVTPALFQSYRAIKDYASADPKTLARLVRSTGFYRNKTKNIIRAAKTILERFGGKVPDRLEDLVTLPGVGRKTANVVLGNAFGVPGISVDTHMIRLNRLLGLTRHKDPVKIERDLMRLVPEENWTEYSGLVIHHGRVRCFARNPDCVHCEISRWCPAGNLPDVKI